MVVGGMATGSLQCNDADAMQMSRPFSTAIRCDTLSFALSGKTPVAPRSHCVCECACVSVSVHV